MTRRVPVDSPEMAPHESPDAPQLSIVLSTYNRGELLEEALRSVLGQDDATAPPFELIVVDNNSADHTRDIVERLGRVDGRLRYVFEGQQGLSHARNRGIRAARAQLIAFTDDDVRVARDWVAGIVRAFAEYPQVDAVGGRVLPLWPATPPKWLTREHWMPLALTDYGDAPMLVTAENPICLVGANVTFRRRVFDLVGTFATNVQRVKDSIGSMEDHEFEMRLMRIGRTGLYDPRIVVHAEVQPNRLQRAYHRRWHTGHGHFHALLRLKELEETTAGTLFGVPAHLYRQALKDLVWWARAVSVGELQRALQFEMRLRFFHGFFRTRRREFLAKPRHERRRERWRLLRQLLVRGGVRLTPETGSGAGQRQV